VAAVRSIGVGQSRIAAAIGVKRPPRQTFTRVGVGSFGFSTHLIGPFEEGIQILRMTLPAVHDGVDRKRYAGFGTPGVKAILTG
jgi:hypothetical protein